MCTGCPFRGNYSPTPAPTLAHRSCAPAVCRSFGSRAARWERPQSSRCFRSLLVCTAPGIGDPEYVWRTGQFMVQQYIAAAPDPKLDFSGPAPAPAGALPAGAEQRTLRIVFHLRPGNVRQILNFEDVFRACTEWSYFSAAKKTLFRAACASHPLKDVPTSIQVAQQADIFIGMHGRRACPDGQGQMPEVLLLVGSLNHSAVLKGAEGRSCLPAPMSQGLMLPMPGS